MKGNQAVSGTSRSQSALIIGAMLTSTLAPGMVQAACVRADLAGSWFLSSVTISDFGSNVSKCQITITGRGGLSGSCIERIPGQRERSDVTGSLRLSDDCALRGSVLQRGVSGVVQGQLAPSGDVLTGIVFSEEAVAQFTAVRR